MAHSRRIGTISAYRKLDYSRRKATMIGHTCGIACWTAQEDICRCSCGGINHGVLRSEGGIQPVRSKKIQGIFYELHSVHRGYGEILKLLERRELPGNFVRSTATRAEVAKWPELTMFRAQSDVDRTMNPPICVWSPSAKYK